MITKRLPKSANAKYWFSTSFQAAHHVVLWYKEKVQVSSGMNIFNHIYALDEQFSLTVPLASNATEERYECEVLPNKVRHTATIRFGPEPSTPAPSLLPAPAGTSASSVNDSAAHGRDISLWLLGLFLAPLQLAVTFRFWSSLSSRPLHKSAPPALRDYVWRCAPQQMSLTLGCSPRITSMAWQICDSCLLCYCIIWENDFPGKRTSQSYRLFKFYTSNSASSTSNIDVLDLIWSKIVCKPLLELRYATYRIELA